MSTQSEMSLDDFSLETPKVVGALEPEKIKEQIGKVNEQGQVQTFSKIEKDVLNNLDQQVDTIMKELLNAPLHSQEMRDITSALNGMGDKEINNTSNMSNRMLDRPLRAMRQNEAGQGKNIADSLKNLRQTVVNLDPSRRSKMFSNTKFLGIKLPFSIGKRVDSYMQEFKSSESQIKDIVNALLHGKDELLEDNAHIDVEREQMHKLMQRLEQYAYVMKKLDERIESQLPGVEAEDKIKASDIRQEILFPLRQKSMDIYQHLAVCMQGYMAMQVVKKNNIELIRGVDRATKTTVSALRTAVILSEALGTQKLVLDQINSVNETTNNLLAQNAVMLKEQGVAIQKQATESSVNVKVLEDAFTQIFQAMDAIDSYREQALPNMKKTIDSLEKTVNNAKSYLSTHRAERIGNFSETLKEEDSKVVKVM